MMLNYCSDTLSSKNRIDFPRTFRIKKKATYRLEYIAFVAFGLGIKQVEGLFCDIVSQADAGCFL